MCREDLCESFRPESKNHRVAHDQQRRRHNSGRNQLCHGGIVARYVSLNEDHLMGGKPFTHPAAIGALNVRVEDWSWVASHLNDSILWQQLGLVPRVPGTKPTWWLLSATRIFEVLPLSKLSRAVEQIV